MASPAKITEADRNRHKVNDQFNDLLAQLLNTSPIAAESSLTRFAKAHFAQLKPMLLADLNYCAAEGINPWEYWTSKTAAQMEVKL